MILRQQNEHEYYMKMAIKEAEAAREEKEIPVGAVIVSNQKVIAKTHNESNRLNDVTAHAEILAITAAAHYLGAKYLKGCTLYVTLEPCVMCGGALFWSQIDMVVFGASDPRRGYSSHPKAILHPKTKIIRGILEESCQALVKDFFRSLRLV